MKRKPAPAKVDMVRVPMRDIEDALEALDAAEQLLELLKGPLNCGTEMFCEDLLSMFQDRIIVAVRVRLARVKPPGEDDGERDA